MRFAYFALISGDVKDLDRYGWLRGAAISGENVRAEAT